ncbi:MAG: flagellar basal body rod protein FlgC [Acidobacteriaceae bacterium]|jgi:flagellar basal-body rod protein FlgC
MNLFGAMEVSGSALEAERIRAEVVAANMANAETTRTAEGGPYLRRHVVFTADTGTSSFSSQLASQVSGPVTSGPMTSGSFSDSEPEMGGVRVSAVVADKDAVLRRYDPGHPDADKDGYVSYPDINPVTEMVDLMGATRSYGLNASAVEAEKSMISTSLDILK